MLLIVLGIEYGVVFVVVALAPRGELNFGKKAFGGIDTDGALERVVVKDGSGSEGVELFVVDKPKSIAVIGLVLFDGIAFIVVYGSVAAEPALLDVI